MNRIPTYIRNVPNKVMISIIITYRHLNPHSNGKQSVPHSKLYIKVGYLLHFSGV